MKRIFTMLIALFLATPLSTSSECTANITSEQTAEPVYVSSGYTATIAGELTADVIYIHINAYHSTDEIYNACEIELSYDTEILRFSRDLSTIGCGAYRDRDGEIMLLDFGADKPLGKSVYVIAFDIVGTGETEIQLCRAAFSTSEKAVSEDVEPIINKPDSITIWIE